MDIQVDSVLRRISIASVVLVASAAAAFAQASAPSTQPSSKASAPATASADQILDKYIQASGGRAAWQKLHSRVSKGTVDVPAASASGTLEVLEKAPDRVLITVTIAGAVFTQGFDGSVGWSNDPQNGLREQTGSELAETRRAGLGLGRDSVGERELPGSVDLRGGERGGCLDQPAVQAGLQVVLAHRVLGDHRVRRGGAAGQAADRLYHGVGQAVVAQRAGRQHPGFLHQVAGTEPEAIAAPGQL